MADVARAAKQVHFILKDKEQAIQERDAALDMTQSELHRVAQQSADAIQLTEQKAKVVVENVVAQTTSAVQDERAAASAVVAKTQAETQLVKEQAEQFVAAAVRDQKQEAAA